MKVIYKYELDITNVICIHMPKDAVILSVQSQKDVPVIWAEVEKNNPPEERYFEIYGTGHTIYSDMEINRKYIGTFQVLGGSFVGHVYEKL